MDSYGYHYDLWRESDIHCRECKYVYNPYAFELHCSKRGKVVQDNGCCKCARRRGEPDPEPVDRTISRTKIINRRDFLESLSPKELAAGHVKFNIPNPEDIYSYNGEGVFGWASADDVRKYQNDDYHGKIEVIMLNYPLYYSGTLEYGDQVTLKCHGNCRPTLDPSWVEEHVE